MREALRENCTTAATLRDASNLNGNVESQREREEQCKTTQPNRNDPENPVVARKNKEQTNTQAPREDVLPSENSENVEPQRIGEPRRPMQCQFPRILPEYVRDIDSGDALKPQYCSAYVNDIFDHHFENEERCLVPADYLEGRQINSRHRNILVNRLIGVHEQFKLTPEVIYLTLNYVDRFLNNNRSIEKKSLHLVGVTAMLIACKIEEVSVPAIQDFVYITDNECSRDDILRMEMNMLLSLDCVLMPVNALIFLRRFSKAGQASPKIHQIAKYLIELSFLNVYFCQKPPSKVAAAALNVARSLSGNAEWDATLAYYSTYSAAELRDLSNKLATILDETNRNPMKSAVYTKFSSPKYSSVAVLPEVRCNSAVRRLAASRSPSATLRGVR